MTIFRSFFKVGIQMNARINGKVSEEDDWDDDWEDDWEDEDEDVEVKPKKEQKVTPEKEKVPTKDTRHNGRKRTAIPTKGGPKRTQPPTRGFRQHPAYIWSSRITITILILLLLFAPIAALENPRDDLLEPLKNLLRPYREFPEWTNVTMEIQYTISVTGGRAEEVEIKVAPPFDIPLGDDPERDRFVVQDVEAVHLTTGESRSRTFPPIDYDDFNTNGNQISGWVLDNFIGTITLNATFQAKLYTYEWDNIDEGNSGKINEIDDYYNSRYLDDEWAVEGEPGQFRYHPNSTRVSRVAEAITQGEDTVYGKVKAIYDWIHEHFNYTTPQQREFDRAKYGNYPKWPEGCLNDWYGDCDDQSLLMASMCRAVRIPAWLEIGYLYDIKMGTWGGHGWFNVVIPVEDDAGGFKQVVVPIDPVNDEFLFRDPYRLTDWVDSGHDLMVDGEPVFNLEYYYNYLSETSPPGTIVQGAADPRSISFEEHGSLKQYVDAKEEYANMEGTEQYTGDLPAPNPLLLAPLSLLLMIPAVRTRFKRRK